MKGKLSDLFLSSKESVIIKPDLAVKLGLNEAIVLRQIYYWLEINEKLQRNYYDGRYWTFNTMEEWQKNNFPWWSTKTIERAFKSLISSGIVITGNYNKDQRDRTKWYSINEDVLENVLNDIVKEEPETNSQCASGQNDERHRQNDEMHKDSSGEALPENTIKDYHSETTIQDTTSPSELKEEEKNAYHSNEWFNSQHIKNMLTEENIQYTPIDRKSFNWSAFKNQVSVRIEELGYTTSPYTTNRFLVVSKYFFKRYEERTRKPHTKINQDALDNILDKFGFGPNPDYFQNVEIETYMKVIDEYFGTSFSEYTDHHYSHFMSGYIRKNLLMKVEDREETL